MNAFPQAFDSLKTELKKTKQDTAKLSILLQLIDNSSSEEEWMQYSEQAEKFAEKLVANSDPLICKKAKAGLATAIFKKAYLLQDQGNVTDALVLYEKSLKIAEEINNKGRIAEILDELGGISADQGNIPKALEYFGRSLKLVEEIGNKPGMAQLYNNIGLIYADQYDFEKAIDYYNKSLKVNQQIGNKEGIGNLCICFGALYYKKQDSETALDYYNKALSITQEIGDPYVIAQVLNNMGAIYLNQNNFARALEVQTKSLKLRESIGDKQGVANSLNNIAGIYLKQKNTSQALLYSERALALSKELGFPGYIRNSEHRLSQIDSVRGNYAGAYSHYKQFILYRDSINNEGTRKATIKSQLKYDFEKKAMADSVRVQGEKKLISSQLKEEKTKSYALYGGLVLVIIFAGFMFNRFRVTSRQKKIIELKEKETQKQNEIISHQKELVEEKHKEITDSINYAERIQRSFLATKELLDSNLQDYFVLFQPKDVVSGDFYWASKLTNGNFAMVIADSTGHGVPGAIMSILNISSLENAIKEESEPSAILNHTRKNIIERLKKDGSAEGGKDGMDASLIIFDRSRKKLFVSAANNPVWIVRGSEAIEVRPDKMPVGKHDRQDVSFSQHEIDLLKGDVVYALTDGFPDQFGGEKGKKFMIKNLRELIVANAHLPMQEQKEVLKTTFSSWVGNLEQVDDVCLIGIRV